MPQAARPLSDFARFFQERRDSEMPLSDYLDGCRSDPMMYATAPERILHAIGEAEMVDTSKDARLGRIFMNRTVRMYPAFAEFFGMEETVERIVSYFRHAAQGLEERKQILYLLGPVGGGKSSLAERLKALMEVCPIYVLKAGDQLSPVVESPLGLFDPERMGPMLEEQYGIPRRRITGLMSPWAIKRLDEFGGDLSRFSVVKVMPSRLRQLGISKTEPGDENNQDISSLVGKVDIRKLETLSQADPDAYSYSGGLNRANQGMLEFVEMFKAPIKMLHPLLTATQEGNYIGTENIGAIPFSGMIMAHSNESEWQSFKTNKNNEAFIDRIYVIKVPYCLRVTEEQRIYTKLIRRGPNCWLEHRARPRHSRCWRGSRFCRRSASGTRTRTMYAKMRVYDGESAEARPTRGRAAYRNTSDSAGVGGGDGGRLHSLRVQGARRDLQPRHRSRSRPIPSTSCTCSNSRSGASSCPRRIPRSATSNSSRAISRRATPSSSVNEIQKAYLESYHDYGQNLFDRYVAYADAWIEDQDYKDSGHRPAAQPGSAEPGADQDREAGGDRQPQGFPQRGREVQRCARVPITMRAAIRPGTSYEKIRDVIEKRMFSQVEELLPVISFGSKKDSDTEKKHDQFVDRMISRGYTERQVRRLVEWYMRVKQAG